MECFAANYQYFFEEDFLDWTHILDLTPDSYQDGGSFMSTSSSLSDSSSPRSTTETWAEVTSLEYQFRQLLFKDISSPLNALDHIRVTEREDFFMNGIERELDEFDHYQVHLRSHPQRSFQPVTMEPRQRQQQVRDEPMRNTVCVFCKNNGETLSVYGSHLLKDNSGRVTCPVLRRYSCPICGTSGDTAHTVRYCPLKKSSLCEYQETMPSCTITENCG